MLCVNKPRRRRRRLRLLTAKKPDGEKKKNSSTKGNTRGYDAEYNAHGPSLCRLKD
jgi:hypothetical protein